MSFGDYSVPLSLSTVCGGMLEDEFQKLYPALLAQLKHGDKASLTIALEFRRVPETTTMVKVNYKVTPKFPATGRDSYCQITGDNRLKTEKPPERPKLVPMFQGGNVNE